MSARRPGTPVGRELLISHLRRLATAVSIFIAATAGPSSAAGWTDPIAITDVATESVMDPVYFTVDNTTPYIPGCLPGSWMINQTTDARQQRFYAALLTAFSTGRKIRLWYTDTCASWGYSQATAVRVVN